MTLPADIAAEFANAFQGTPWDVATFRLVAACLLGGAIGFERELHNRRAGLRTHILISMAACLFALIAFELMARTAGDAPQVRSDPLRLIEAVTAGVAFLAAGTIINGRHGVHGLTTGAGMWMAGAVGLACGIGQTALAAIATGLAVAVLWAFRRLSHWIGPD